MRDTETGSPNTGMSIETDDVDALLNEATAQIGGDTSAVNPKKNVTKAAKKSRIGGDVRKLGDFGGSVAIQDNNDLAALMNSERPAVKKPKLKNTDIIFHVFVALTMAILAAIHMFLI